MPTTAVLTQTERPGALIVWERRERERLNAWLAGYDSSYEIPTRDYHVFLTDGRPLFFFMYQQLTSAQKEAEIKRLNDALAADPADTRAERNAYVWHYHVRAWNLEQRRCRKEAEDDAVRLTEPVLKRCIYLGGYHASPGCSQRCAAFVTIATDGDLSFRTRGDREICSLPWSAILGIHVLPSESPPPQRRWRLTRPIFARRHQALLHIATTGGNARFIVQGPNDNELECALTSLIACLDQPTADTYDETRSHSYASGTTSSEQHDAFPAA
jgi:hypothetical protein